MRRLVFSLCALLFAAALCIFASVLIKKSTSEFSEAILVVAQTTEDESDIKANSEKIEDTWKKKKKPISFFVNDEIFAEADVRIRRLKYSTDIEEFRARCLQASEYVAKTADGELPAIENLF